MQTDATTDAWLRARGIVPDPEFWVLDVALTTTDAENKLYARKNLRPEDVTLELTLYGSGSWNVTCVRHDGTYRARWDRHRQPEVEAQALKYRRFLKWPTVDGPDDFPALVPKLEALLDIRFRRHVNVNGDRLDVLPGIRHGGGLRRWLAGVADTFGTVWRTEAATLRDGA